MESSKVKEIVSLPFIRKRVLSLYPLLLCILFCAFNLYKQQHTNQLMLSATVNSKSMGVAQVFWDIGNGFNETDSDSRIVYQTNSSIDLEFLLPKGVIRNIRFDPNNEPSHITLSTLCIKNGNDKIIVDLSEQWNIAAGASYASNNKSKLIIETDDPILSVTTNYSELNSIITNYPKGLNLKVIIITFLQNIAIVYGCYILLGSRLTPILLAYMSWSIFAPGILTHDSIDQYWQAAHNHFSNWHPPGMAIMLHILIKAGLELSNIILIQTILAFLGVDLLIDNIYQIFFAKNGKSQKVSPYVKALLFLLLLCPLTTFAPFVSTFWKDVWFAIVMIWILNLTIDLHLHTQRHRSIRLSESIMMVLLMVASISLRHNAILLIPVYLIICWIVHQNEHKFIKSLMTAIVLVGCVFSNALLNTFFNVHKLDPKQSIMGLEIVGMIMVRPEIIDEFPYTKSQLKPTYKQYFDFAAYDYQRWGAVNQEPYMKPDFVKANKNPKLKAEYIQALKTHPFLISYVKWLNYIRLIDPSITTEWCPAGIIKNEFGFKPNRLLRDLREFYHHKSDQIYQHSALRWISGVHLPWIVISLFYLGFSIVTLKNKPNTDSLIKMLLLSVAPIYSFSYVIAIPWTAFRYIYPGTLLTQITTFVFLLHTIQIVLKRKVS